MTQKFINGMEFLANFTETENGAVALKSTGSALVDLFGQIGAMRNRRQDIESAFIKAFAEDRLLATKMAFYARDIRFGGLGEREVFRIIMKFLANVHPDVVAKNMMYIPFFGRYDDLYVFIGTPAEEYMWNLIRYQWNQDRENMKVGKPISLMAKWLKSINTSSMESRKLGKLTAEKLNLSDKAYRKSLAIFREYLNIVERHMSSKSWERIEYDKVPSKAMTVYRKAFSKNDTERFTDFMAAVEKGEKKINASTLFPYNILEGMCSYGFRLGFIKYDEVLEAQWKALPNYVEGENNIIIMADTSGSMNGRPLATSVGLAIYFAERNHGPYKNMFMTFAERPSWVQLRGETLYEKVQCVPDIAQNTDFEAALKLVLDVAVKNELAPEEMPKSLVVISDMQFDEAEGYGRRIDDTWTFYDTMVDMYRDYGYEMPNIVFWNVDSRRDSFQASSNYKGVQLASGQSASVFKSILKTIGCTPYEAMLQTLNNTVYDCITV